MARNRDVKGTKAVLVERLRDVLQEEGVDVVVFIERLVGNSATGEGQNKKRQVGQSAASAVVTSHTEWGSEPSRPDVENSTAVTEVRCAGMAGPGALVRAPGAGQ